MAKRGVEGYVRSLLDNGYPEWIIRDKLAGSGYGEDEINKAFEAAYKGASGSRFRMSPVIITLILMLVLSIAGAVYYFAFYGEINSSGSIKLALRLGLSDAVPGGSVSFMKEIENLEPRKSAQGSMKHELIALDNNAVIAALEEKGNLEEISKPAKLSIPSDAREGNYLLRTILFYEDKREIATIQMKIESNLSNKGSRLLPATTTTTLIDVRTPQKPVDVQILEPSDALEKIKELAKSDERESLSKCSEFRTDTLRNTCYYAVSEAAKNENHCVEITDARIKDSCFKNMAKIKKDDSICERISTAEGKDSCYTVFILDFDDYSVCFKVNNEDLKSSCESLRDANV